MSRYLNGILCATPMMFRIPFILLELHFCLVLMQYHFSGIHSYGLQAGDEGDDEASLSGWLRGRDDRYYPFCEGGPDTYLTDFSSNLDY